MQYTDFIIDIVIIRFIVSTFNINITMTGFNINFIVSAIFTTIIAWKINILSYISKFMAYNVQALHSISLINVQKACLPVLLTLLSS